MCIADDDTFFEKEVTYEHVFDIHKMRFGVYYCPEEGCGQVFSELFWNKIFKY